MIQISEQMSAAIIEAANQILATGQNMVSVEGYSVALDHTPEYHSVDEDAFLYTFSHEEKFFHVAIL